MAERDTLGCISAVPSLRVRPVSPAGAQGQWIKTVPGHGWFAYLRIYGPEQSLFDWTWKPVDFEEVAPKEVPEWSAAAMLKLSIPRNLLSPAVILG